MSDIDPEKLEEAIKAALDRAAYDTQANAPYASGPNAQQHLMLACAAGAHLATLPRWKEVERECFEVVDQAGGRHGFYPSHAAAESIAGLGPCRFIVRLTGTAKVRA